MDKLQLLETVLGKSVKSNRDFHQFACPFCNHHKKKLGVSLGSGMWKCWVCPARGRSVYALFKKLNAPVYLLSQVRNLWHEKEVHVIKAEPQQLKLPNEFKPLWVNSTSIFYRKAKNYLESRGISEQDIVKHHIGYCDSGSYSDMIVFPSYSDTGELKFYSARSYLKEPRLKFSICKGINKNDVVFDDLLINWDEPIILCESKLDAIVIKRNAIPLFGKQLTQRLKQKIVEERPPKIIFCLDGDALADAIRQAGYFVKNGIPVFKSNIPVDDDPNSLGYEKVWEYINDSQEITELESFEFNFLSKLK